MKILLSHSWFEHKEPLVENFARAFSLLGHETKIFYDNDEKSFPYFLYKALLRTPSRSLALRALQYYREKRSRVFLKEIERFRPDFIFVLQASHISSTVPKMVAKRYKIPIALWVADDTLTRHMFDPFFIETHFYYSHLFVADEYWIPSLRLLGEAWISYLPFATSEEFFHPLHTKEDIDIVYVGLLGNGPNISKSVILSALKDFNLTVAGPEITKHIGTIKTNNKINVLEGFLHSREINKLYNRAKIVLSLHHVQFKSDPGPRVFDAAACRAFQLAEFRQNIPALFDGKVVTFSSPHDLKTKVSYYLNHPAAREKNLEDCYRLALERHTYVARAAQVLKAVFDS